MKKTYIMFVALLTMLIGGVTKAHAGETAISLEEVPFWQHVTDMWGLNAVKENAAECAWVIDAPSGQPYGDPGVNNFADLSTFTRLEVAYTEGTPRILMNRDAEGGQCSATESQSHLIDNTNNDCMSWASKYFKTEDGVIIVDLKQMVKDKGYAHLHAIKGANWSDVTVTSMIVYRDKKEVQVGWVNLINNSNMEGDDVSSFFTKVDRGEPLPSEITDGVGVNGSRGIMVAATAKVAEAWDNQFWFRFNEPVNADTKYRVSFDYRADTPAKASTQAHAEPSDYIHWQMLGDVEFATDWQTFSTEGTVSAEQSTEAKKFLSVAFNLSEIAEANNYYFDNIKFEVYKFGNTAEFYSDAVKLDFGFDTNLPDLVKATGKPRLVFPSGCATVKVNGNTVELYSVEGYADGRFYIFLQDAVDDNADVLVSFTNPADAAFHLVYSGGPNDGNDVSNIIDLVADLNTNPAEDAYPYDFVTPIIVSADPEEGSFNLPNSIKEFKVTFDKNVDCAALQATLNGQKLAVQPAEGFAEQVTLVRDGADLSDGEYAMHITKIYPEQRLDDAIFGDTTYVFNVGKVVVDPNDVEELVMTDDFANGGEGWWVNADQVDGVDQPLQPANSGSGCRLMHGQNSAQGGNGFADDILYLSQRSTSTGGVAVFGLNEKKLTLKAKTYNLSLSAAKWDGGGAARSLKVQVFTADAVDPYDGHVMDGYEPIVEVKKAIEPDFKTSTNATEFDIKVPITAEGDYVLRLVPGNPDGNPAGFNDASAIGKVKFEYLPNVVGAEWVRLLDAALEKAKTAMETCSNERYAGEAYDALVAAITKYEAEKDGYTAPSAYQAAADVLTTCAANASAHRALCDDYDTNVKKAIDVVRQNEMPDGDPAKATKFTKTELFAQLKEIVAKYNGTSQWVDNAEPGTVNEEGEEVHDWQLIYTYDLLTDDALLTAAIAELKDIANTTSLLFTEGVSATGDHGIKVLVDRFRRGVETMKALGIAEDDNVMVAANMAMEDDDALAERVKKRIKQELYGQLKEANNTLFEEKLDETTLENTTPTYDMSVFFKNPNIYALQVKNGFNAENVPGWETPVGSGDITTMWVGGTPRNVPGIAEDVALTKYRALVRYEQTIYDLPAGVYTIVLDAVSWADDDRTDGFVYVKTSDTPAVEEGEEEDRDLNFAATVDLEYWGQYQGHHDNEITDIVVTDGQLTVGANFGPNSQWMFDQVKAILMTAPATGFDYNQAYLDGIDATVAQPAKVRAIELFDLNGRRINTARQGIVIVKKHMSDGTVRTEKVIKK